MSSLDFNALAGGALVEKVQAELERVAANISDPNTKAKAARSVTVEIKFAPDETRQVVLSEINVKSKLAPATGIPTKFIIDRDNSGKAVIAELASGAKNQMMIDKDGELADPTGRKVDPETGEIKDKPELKVVGGPSYR